MCLPKLQFEETYTSSLTSSLIGVVTTLIVVLAIYLTNIIRYIGHIEQIYIPGCIVLIDIIKAVWTKKNRFSGKLLKWTIFKVILLIFVSICIFFILAILYGAPAFTEHEQTLMLAIYLTVCTTIHCLINMGFKQFSLMLTKPNLTSLTVLNEAQIVACTSIFGCWVSAVVIPLDWDRWWQKWPIPSIVGTLIGYQFGYVLSVLLLYYHKKHKGILKL